MNAPTDIPVTGGLPDVAAAMPDVQGSHDDRRLVIERVGIRGVRHPVRWRTEAPVSGSGPALASVGFWTLDVMLPANQKGTHMSRFVALLEAQAASPEPLDVPAFRRMLARMVELLDAPAGGIEVTFPFFVRKTAPVSGVESLMDYQVTVSGRVPAPVAPLAGGDGAPRSADDLARDAEMTLTVIVPVTSLCPCSKGISDYGAHNQRSHVTVQARLAAEELSVESLIRRVEAQASCELWGLLKRPDEKFVTERAYDNPKFVEDLVRDVAGALRGEPAIASFVVDAENFESIHNHSAWARITSD